MKRLALTVVLALGGVAAFAQTNPTDVPPNHWAAKAVTDLYRLGVLKGYPDGQFRGARPATRYELAQGLDALVREQASGLAALQSEVTTLRTRIDALTPPQVDVQGLAEIRRRLDAAESQVKVVQGYRSEIDALTRQFESLLERIREVRRKAQSRDQ